MNAFTEPHFQDDEAARELIEFQSVGRNGPVCAALRRSRAPLCHEAARSVSLRQSRLPQGLHRHDRTVMELSHIPLHKWMMGFYLMAASKKGMSAHQLHRSLGVTYKSAWFMAHRIREAMRAGGLVPPLGGDWQGC